MATKSLAETIAVGASAASSTARSSRLTVCIASGGVLSGATTDNRREQTRRHRHSEHVTEQALQLATVLKTELAQR